MQTCGLPINAEYYSVHFFPKFRTLEQKIEGPVVLNVATWVFPKIGVPQNGWFIMENHIKVDDLGGFHPLFLETPNLNQMIRQAFDATLIALRYRSTSSRRRQKVCWAIWYLGALKRLSKDDTRCLVIWNNRCFNDFVCESKGRMFDCRCIRVNLELELVIKHLRNIRNIYKALHKKVSSKLQTFAKSTLP